MQIKRPETWNKYSLAACIDYLFGRRAKYKPVDVVLDEWVFWAESQGWQFEPPTFPLFPHQESMLEWMEKYAKPLKIVTPANTGKFFCMGQV